MYYRGTIEALHSRIKEMAPGTRAKRLDPKMGQIAQLSHLLWMCYEVEGMDTLDDDSAQKAARWIGWILAHAEINALWDNEKSRDLIREDRRRGYDKCHHSGM